MSRIDIYNELEDEYFKALDQAEENGSVYFTVILDDEDEEEFNTFEEARQFAIENNIDQIRVSPFSIAWGAYDAGEYEEYDATILDLDKNIIETLNEGWKRKKRRRFKSKKPVQGWFTNYNAGNVEQGIDIFNHLTDIGDVGEGMGESINKKYKISNKPKKERYTYNDINQIEDYEYFTNHKINESLTFKSNEGRWKAFINEKFYKAWWETDEDSENNFLECFYKANLTRDDYKNWKKKI